MIFFLCRRNEKRIDLRSHCWFRFFRFFCSESLVKKRERARKKSVNRLQILLIVFRVVMLRLRATKSALEALVGEARALALGTSFPSMTSTSSAVVSSSSSNTSHSNASFSSSSYSSSSSSTKGPEEERECSTSATTRDESALFALDCPTFSMTTSTAAAEPTLIIGGRWNEAFASSSSCSVLSPSQSASATSSAYHGLLWQQQRRWMAVPKKKVRSFFDFCFFRTLDLFSCL